MNAILSKGKETVRFEWDDHTACGLVKVMQSNPVNDRYETLQFAREYWKQLTISGFRRTSEKVPETLAS